MKIMFRYLLLFFSILFVPQKAVNAQVYRDNSTGAFYVGYGFSAFKNVAPLEIYASLRDADTKKDGFGSFRYHQGLTFRFCSALGDGKATKKGGIYYRWSIELSWANKHVKRDAVYEDSDKLGMRQKIRLRMNSFNIGFIYTPPIQVLSFGFSGDIGLLSCKTKWYVNGKSDKWEPLFQSDGIGTKRAPVVNYSIFGQLNFGPVSIRLSKQSVLMTAELGPTFYTENFNLSAYFRF